jgi:oligopeptide transport system ATP-binding protein
MQIDIQKVVFDFNQKVMKIKRGLQNEALLKFNNEVKIANDKLNHKLNGLKDSAALDSQTIANRMQELKSSHAKQLESLKAFYDPQIQDNASSMLTKVQVKNQINQLTLEKNKQLLVIKASYSKQMAALVQPDKGQHQKSIQGIEEKYNKSFKILDTKIATVNKDLAKKITSLPKAQTAFKKTDKSNTHIHQLKVVADLKIKELHGKISEARRINASKDTLKESQKMQMIFQDPISSLNPRMTVKEIISEGLVIQGNLSKKVIEKKVEEVLNLVGLSPEYASRYPHEFSGGQRQRIGVARALIMDPNVIIADEPISSLDVSIRAQIINLLFTLREKLGLTILFIAHDLSVVRFFCDRIAVMYNGRVVEMADSEELFKNPMHPYSVSLLSAIPQPDPDYEKNRKRVNYNPGQHQYNSSNLPTLREIAPKHLVLASEAEFEKMKKSYHQVSKKGGS